MAWVSLSGFSVAMKLHSDAREQYHGLLLGRPTINDKKSGRSVHVSHSSPIAVRESTVASP